MKQIKVTSRYDKHIKIGSFGPEGQRAVSSKKVAVIGCGALGTNIADLLVRGGVGEILLVDRDIVELSNLHRQVLYSEKDIGSPKAERAASKLKDVNSEIEIKYLIKDVMSSNISEIVKGYDLIMDGTDNIPVRLLINDYSISEGTPWIYGGVLGTGGMVMSITGEGPCLRCLIPELPEQGDVLTCETMGVLNTVPAMTASVQVTEGFKVLTGKEQMKGLLQFDVWKNDFSIHEFKKDPQCLCCGKKEFSYLNEENEEQITVLCDESVQIILSGTSEADLNLIASNLKGVKNLNVNPFRLEFEAEGKNVTIFKDRRIIIKGTGDKGVARSLYSKYLGL
ncbi:MAG: ThiF family adenylyltransferase [Acidobacteriota bacterium]